MKIWKAPFGETKEGCLASKYFVENKNGTVAVVSDFGVTLLAFCFAGKDLVLGYDNLWDHKTHDRYFGATVGRFAGPVPDGKLQIGDMVYQLTKNDEGNPLHGGFVGFTFRLWDSEILEDGVRFTLTSSHGEEGFPGNLKVSVFCRLTEDDSLHYIYDGVSDRDTVRNMTCHAYFNLDGQYGKDNTWYQPYGAFCIETQHCLSSGEAEQRILNPVLNISL